MKFIKINFPTANKIWEVLSKVEKRNAIILIFLLLVGMVLEALGISLVIPAIALFTQDDISVNYPILKPILDSFGNPSHMTQVRWGLIILLLVFVIKNMFLAFLVWAQAKFTQTLGARLSSSLYSIYLQQPYNFHLQHNSSILIRNIYTEVNVFTGAMNSFLLLLSESFVLLGLFVMLIIIEPLSAISVVILLGFSVITFHRFTRKTISKWGIDRQHHDGFRIQHIQQGLGGVKDSMLLGREKDFIEEFSFHNKRNYEIARKITALKQMPRLLLEVLAVLAMVVVFFMMLMQGKAIGTILPVLAFFAVTAFRLMPSANRILGAVQEVTFHLPVINVLFKDLKLPLIGSKNNLDEKLLFKKNINISKISFHYENSNEPVIKDMSFMINSGESIGIIGPSGSGKSTLVDIILGLLKPSSGEVLVDGLNIDNNIRNWQDKIGYVSQSIYLTDDSLRRNVAFGLSNENISEVALKNAIKAAQLDEFINELPNGLDTIVGEDGVRLSGGQRQRIGIARALYHDPLVLVLDEATSSLDMKTEASVMKAIDELRGKKTIIIIAHRLSTVANCDRIHMLKKGLVVSTGSPKEVLRKNDELQ